MHIIHISKLFYPLIHSITFLNTSFPIYLEFQAIIQRRIAYKLKIWLKKAAWWTLLIECALLAKISLVGFIHFFS